MENSTTKHHIHQRPYHHIQHKDNIGIHPEINQSVSHYNKANSHKLDAEHRSTGGQAHVQEFVVKMGAIGLERIGLALHSAQHYPDDIQAWNQQNAESGN